MATDKPLLHWDANTGDLGLRIALTVDTIHSDTEAPLKHGRFDSGLRFFLFFFCFVCFFVVVVVVVLFLFFCFCFFFTMRGQGGLYEARHKYKTRFRVLYICGLGQLEEVVQYLY